MISEIYSENILGARNSQTLLVSFVLFVAGLSFFLIGLSSYVGKNFFLLTDTSEIHFLPQGIVMLFYGTSAFFISLYLVASIIWNIGGGYNEFSQKDKSIRLIRQGFPGKNKKVFFSYEFALIKSLKFFVKEGVNPRCTLYLVLKDKREIPLYPSQFFLSFSEIEKRALFLSAFLNVPIETKKSV